uniref:Survival Motor Neuron Gemin2-binding domain-containing protein n=6 Tax=Triticinae TaxID=1648030 RepID=A0A453PBM4_AEGTS
LVTAAGFTGAEAHFLFARGKAQLVGGGSRENLAREEMGKGGELWDDSALVDAFDHAVATYKAMHGKNNQGAPSEKQESEDVAAAAAYAAAAVAEEPVSTEVADEQTEKNDSCTNLPIGPVETPQQPCEERNTDKQAPLQETDLGKETKISESKTCFSDVTNTEGKDSSNQQIEDYNELLRKYYELEVQSQKVLEQLHQTNFWNYQTPEQSSAYQQQQVPAYIATAPDPNSSTTQTSCCSLNVPMVSISCCSTGQQSGDSSGMPPNGGCSISFTCDHCPGASTTYPTGAAFTQLPTKVSTGDDQVAKAAMMTAEGAMNFMRNTISGDAASFPNIGNEGGIGKENNTTLGMNLNLDTTGADSDLAVVLNAWYTAGFYTGRYLMQQSMKNPREN